MVTCVKYFALNYVAVVVFRYQPNSDQRKEHEHLNEQATLIVSD